MSYILDFVLEKNAIEEKEGQKGKGTSQPGRAVIVSGTSTEPPFDDVPVDLSSDDKDLVMEYSGKIIIIIIIIVIIINFI